MTDSLYGLPIHNWLATAAAAPFRCTVKALSSFFPVALRHYPRWLVPNTATHI